jgi:glycosyltransferase involved in cell wall biosynthesis
MCLGRGMFLPSARETYTDGSRAVEPISIRPKRQPVIMSTQPQTHELSSSIAVTENGKSGHEPQLLEIGICNELVTIVIPCYKGARFIGEAIESCLRQSYHKIEVIVVDDASPDDCAAIAEQYAQRDSRVRVIRRPENGGVSRAFNSGFEAANGQYFTRLAQDDVFHEKAIEAMVRHLERNGRVGLTYCDTQSIDENGRARGRPRVLPVASNVLKWRNLVGLCVMWRRTVWKAVGGFDPVFDTAEDHEYWLRVSRSFLLSKCPGGPYFYSRHHENVGSLVFADRQEAANILLVKMSHQSKSLKNRISKLRALSYIAYSAATSYTCKGMQTKAFTRTIRSLVLWPWPYPRDGSARPFIRFKTLVVVSMRMLRLRASP